MKLKEKIKTEKINKRQLKAIAVWLQRLLWGALSFVMSFSSVVGGCCPFAISLITVSDRKNFLFSAVGAGLGYIFFCSGDNAVRYFSCVIIAALGTFAVNVFKGKKDAALPITIAFLSVLTTGFVINVRNAAGAADYALTLGEAILAAGGSFFFYRAVNCNLKRLKFRALSITDLTCVVISASLLLSALSFIEIGGVSPARIFAVLLILSTVRYGTAQWGMTVSLCLGFALGISRENSLFLLGAYAFSALVSSLFTSFSSVGVGLSYTLSMAFFAVAADMGSFSVCCVAESFIAAVILALLPEAVTEKISEIWESKTDAAPEGSLRQSLVVRLRFAAGALAQVSESVSDVREKINMLGRGEPTENELRMAAADQFFSISDMLEDLAFEFDEAEHFDFTAAGRIRRMLGEYDIYPENISVISDKFDRVRVEILAPRDTKGIDSPRIKNEISKICRRDFEKGRLSSSPAGQLLSLIEKASYKMSIGFAQYSAEGSLCGDTVKTINDSRGHMILIISDGMGKGGRAALDGAMGAGLLSKLLGAGFGFDSSLKVVNSALLVKSSEESLATLDCASVDLFTGKCEFYKAGAAASYIIKHNRLTKCELSSMPAGILRGVEFAKRTTVLGVGDEIIMMSDGVTDTGEDALEGFLKYDDSESPDEKANAILSFALKNSDERHRDDMSVIVARLIDNS